MGILARFCQKEFSLKNIAEKTLKFSTKVVIYKSDILLMNHLFLMEDLSLTHISWLKLTNNV